MSHTPGPWELDDEDSVYGTAVSGVDLLICIRRSPNDADMDLIAAAPDLLEALGLSEAALCQQGLQGTYPEIIVKARSAIKKAKGEA